METVPNMIYNFNLIIALNKQKNKNRKHPPITYSLQRTCHTYPHAVVWVHHRLEAAVHQVPMWEPHMVLILFSPLPLLQVKLCPPLKIHMLKPLMHSASERDLIWK